jgi:hypothetical protein
MSTGVIDLLGDDIVKEICSWLTLATDTINLLITNKRLAQLAIQSMSINEEALRQSRDKYDAAQRGWLRWFIGPLIVTYKTVDLPTFSVMTRWEMPTAFTWIPELTARYKQQLIEYTGMIMKPSRAMSLLINYRWCSLINDVDIDGLLRAYARDNDQEMGLSTARYYLTNHPFASCRVKTTNCAVDVVYAHVCRPSAWFHQNTRCIVDHCMKLLKVVFDSKQYCISCARDPYSSYVDILNSLINRLIAMQLIHHVEFIVTSCPEATFYISLEMRDMVFYFAYKRGCPLTLGASRIVEQYVYFLEKLLPRCSNLRLREQFAGSSLPFAIGDFERYQKIISLNHDDHHHPTPEYTAAMRELLG